MYPYLGYIVENENNIIVFFISENKGVVLYNDGSQNLDYTVGRLGEFDEDEWEFYPEGSYVRLSN